MSSYSTGKFDKRTRLGSQAKFLSLYGKEKKSFDWLLKPFQSMTGSENR